MPHSPPALMLRPRPVQAQPGRTGGGSRGLGEAWLCAHDAGGASKGCLLAHQGKISWVQHMSPCLRASRIRGHAKPTPMALTGWQKQGRSWPRNRALVKKAGPQGFREGAAGDGGRAGLPPLAFALESHGRQDPQVIPEGEARGESTKALGQRQPLTSKDSGTGTGKDEREGRDPSPHIGSLRTCSPHPR